MTHWQNSHVTLPSSWISVVLDRPQLRQCQFRTTVFMDARFLAEGRRRTRTDRGAGPSGGSEDRSLSRAAEAAGVTPRGAVESQTARFPAVSAVFRGRSASPRWWSKPASRASCRSLSWRKSMSATRTQEESSASPRRRLPEGKSGGRDPGRLGRRGEGLEGRRRNGSGRPFDPEYETRGCPEGDDRGGVGSRGRGLRGLLLRRVGRTVRLRAAEPDCAESDCRQYATDALHRSPSVGDKFCRFGLRFADPLWRARFGPSLQVIEV